MNLMNYKYPPIYKYGILLLIVYMFLKHQYIMTSNKLLINSVVITLFVIVLDYILIKNHPGPMENNQEKKKIKKNEDATFTDDDIENIINNYDESQNSSRHAMRTDRGRRQDQYEMIPGMFQQNDEIMWQ